MTIRRRRQLQASTASQTITRSISLTCQVEGRGLVTPDVAGSNCTCTIYDPAGAVVTTVTITSQTASVISASFNVPQTLGEDYRAVFDWFEATTPSTLRFRQTVWFDVIREEWYSDVSRQTLEDLVPSIRYRLTKQGSLKTSAQTVDQLAATYISDARDHFFNWLAKIVRETNRRSWVALIPDNQRFDSVVACLAVAFAFRADVEAGGDDDDYLFKLWYGYAQDEFSMMKLLEYDADQDGIPETDIQGPFRPEPTFEELQRG